MVKIVVLHTFLHCSKVGSNISFFPYLLLSVANIAKKEFSILLLR